MRDYFAIKWVPLPAESKGKGEPSWNALLRGPGLARSFKFVAGEPFNALRLFAGQPAQHKAKARHLGIATKIPVCAVLVGGLVIVVLHEIPGLLFSPSLIVTLKEIALIDGEGWNAGPGQREVV